MFFQKTTCIRPPRWTFWALSPSWCAAPLPPYAQSSKRLGLMVGCDHIHCCVKVFDIPGLKLCHFLSLGQSPHLLPWPRCRRVRGVLTGTMTRFTCSSVRRLWSATATTNLPSPELPVFARWLSLLRTLLFSLQFNSPMHSNVKWAFPLAVTPFFPLVDYPSRLCIWAFCPCAHRGMLEVSGLYKRSGHPSWRPDWTVRCWSLSCLTSFRTLTAGVTPAAAGVTVCSTVCSRHSRTSKQ